MKATFGAMLLLGSTDNSIEGVKVSYDHWTVERLDDSNPKTWIDSSPMAAYGRSELEDTFLQLRAEKPYDHWTDERLGNSNATSWEESSPMAAYGPRWKSFAQTNAKSAYDHWTVERLDASNETTWVESSPMKDFGS